MSEVLGIFLGLVVVIVIQPVASLVRKANKTRIKKRELANTIVIEGRVREAVVEEKRPILIASGAMVEGDVTAPKVSVAGRVTGDIAASKRVEVLEGGRVTGRLDAPIIVLYEGASVEGDLVASRIAVDGKVVGNVTASELLDVLSNGSIIGKLDVSCLLLSEDAYVWGLTDSTKENSKS